MASFYLIIGLLNDTTRWKRLRVAILAIGTLGDVLPYIALGTGLKKAGLSMVIATHPSFKKP